MKMAGTGSKQEDQIITVAMEKTTGVKFTYIPFKGGGEVATQLVGKHVDSTVNNPIEAVAQWRAGNLRPLCVFDEKRMPYKKKVTENMSWGDIPTCKEAGLDADYVMLRGIFMPPGVSREQCSTTSSSSRRCARRPSGRSSWRRARSTDLHERQGVRRLGREGRAAPRGADEEAGFLAEK